jgi:hypothetical protein
VTVIETVGAYVPTPPPAPPLRHAVCGYVHRYSQTRGHIARAEALCGTSTEVPAPPGDNCPQCVARAAQHAERCDCFKIYSPDARLPRRVSRVPEVSEDQARAILERHGMPYSGPIDVHQRPTCSQGFRGGRVPPGHNCDGGCRR